ncbi:hypothetical protein ABZ553_03975 [Streptomyces sparsogenes]|uniref:hypothetical protein n=1 Tax=Streptomyces sparsogenes TaxID=67365 RepID=UPI0033DE4695
MTAPELPGVTAVVTDGSSGSARTSWSAATARLGVPTGRLLICTRWQVAALAWACLGRDPLVWSSAAGSTAAPPSILSHSPVVWSVGHGLRQTPSHP